MFKNHQLSSRISGERTRPRVPHSAPRRVHQETAALGASCVSARAPKARAGRAIARKARALPIQVAFASFAFFALYSLAHAEQLSSAEVKTLLNQLRQKRAAEPHMQADFREEKVIRLMNKPIISAGKVWFQAPNKFRREIRGSSPSVTVSDGNQLWIYYPNFKSAEKYSLGKRSPLEPVIAAINTALNLENVENTFHITAAKLNNHYELELLPRTPSTKRMLQKLNLRVNADLFVERMEMLQPNGDRIVTTYSNHARAPIPRSTFEFVPPPGTDVTTPLERQ